jgi:glycosyltransferase involved in cell wall biosynthesis
MIKPNDQKNCILFSTADWNAPCWTNKQHTTHHLALTGYRVLYIESIGLRAPTLNKKDSRRIWQRLKRGLKPPRQVENNVWVLSPLAIPFKQHWLIVRIINQGYLNLGIKLFMLMHRFKNPLIWSYHPFIQSAIKGITRNALIYHCVDDLAAVPGINKEKFNIEEQQFLSLCDFVFVTSKSLENKCKISSANVYYFPNVVDVDHFDPVNTNNILPADLEKIPLPRIAYVGVLSDFKMDLNLVKQTIQLRPNFNWVFIGDEREGQNNPDLCKLKDLSNVYFLGHKSYNQLPQYLHGMDVGTLPTLINDYTKSMFPMKYFEYLAAGVPVVSTALDFIKDHQDEVRIANNPQEFIDAIDVQLHRGKLNKTEILNCIGENTWSARLKKMLFIIERRP